MIEGAKWYFLTADYAFGHDLYRVSSRFLEENGGVNLGNDWCRPTPDYSAYILKIRKANPDFVYINLAGIDQTTFLKQYREYGLPYALAGGRHGHDSVLGRRVSTRFPDIGRACGFTRCRHRSRYMRSPRSSSARSVIRRTTRRGAITSPPRS